MPVVNDIVRFIPANKSIMIPEEGRKRLSACRHQFFIRAQRRRKGPSTLKSLHTDKLYNRITIAAEDYPSLAV